MRETKQTFYIYHIVEAVAGQLYRMAPRNRPRDIDKIMSHVLDEAEKVAVNADTQRTLNMKYSAFSNWLTNTLKSCPEFRNLNLSQNEVDKGVSVSDESRPTFAFTSAYDVETKDSWRDDFIDLDAAIRNIFNCILAAHEDTDCFLCDHAETDSDVCNTCINNYRSYMNQYISTNKPHNPTKYAGWCNTSCPEGVAVCCKDCAKRDNCTLTDKCDDAYDNCPRYVVNPNR